MQETGSIRTASRVLEAASRTIKHTHLELGGKAPVIVYDDVDTQALIEGVRGFSFYNAGQDCTQPCRLYVADRIYDNLVADLASPERPGMSTREMTETVCERLVCATTQSP